MLKKARELSKYKAALYFWPVSTRNEYFKGKWQLVLKVEALVETADKHNQKTCSISADVCEILKHYA